MKAVPYRPSGRGPFRAEQIRPGDPYELSDGHAILSEPSGRRHGRKHLVGGVADEPGFARSAPPLAVEYVEADADERDLERKIAQLLGAGSALV